MAGYPKGNIPLALGHPIGAAASLLARGFQRGTAFPFGRKNPKKPAVSWHTTFLGKSSVLYLCGADGSRSCSTPRRVWLQLRRSGGKGCPLVGQHKRQKKGQGGADIFLDWLCNHPKALSVLPRTHISK